MSWLRYELPRFACTLLSDQTEIRHSSSFHPQDWGANCLAVTSAWSSGQVWFNHPDPYRHSKYPLHHYLLCTCIHLVLLSSLKLTTWQRQSWLHREHLSLSGKNYCIIQVTKAGQKERRALLSLSCLIQPWPWLSFHILYLHIASSAAVTDKG